MRLTAPLILALFVCGAAHAAGGFDPHAATQAYLASVPAAARAKSDAYFEGGYWLILWNALAGIGVSVLLMASGWSVAIRRLAFRVGGWRWAAEAIYGAVYVVVISVLTLPLDVYVGYFREHQYGMSNQTLGAWGSDTLIGLAVSVVSAAIVLPVLYAVIRRAPRTWWIWGSGVVVGFFAISIVIGPVFLEPLFNNFQPLPAGPTREAILSLARSNGVPADNVLEFDNSRQTKRISGHVSGLLGTTRISLNDNLINQGTADEVLAVMGHEMGHYVMNHIYGLMMNVLLLVALGFALTKSALAQLLARFGQRWGVEGPADIAGLPILVGCFTLYGLLLTPITNTLIRTEEMQADIFGLNLARRPDAFATMALKLSTYRKLEPSAWEEFVFYDHPSGRTRIETAMRWKAEQGQGALPPGPPLEAGPPDLH